MGTLIQSYRVMRATDVTIQGNGGSMTQLYRMMGLILQSYRVMGAHDTITQGYGGQSQNMVKKYEL